MDVTDAIRTNAAARSYVTEAVPDEVLHRILDTARFAPSGANQQPWHVIVLRDRAKREAIRPLMQTCWNEYIAQRDAGHRPFAPGEDGRWHGPAIDLAAARERHVDNPLLDGLVDAPAVLVVAVRLTALAMMDCELDRVRIASGASIYPFCQNILLAARGEGLHGVITTFLIREEEAARPILGLPRDHAIAAVIVLGKAVSAPTRLTRKRVEEFTTYDSFDGPTFAG